MSGEIDELVRLLELEEREPGGFESRAVDTDLKRLYGGQVVAQALMAAGRTVPTGRAVHSMHAYFVKSGAPAAPISFAVEVVRDSGSFATRRVVATQGGRMLLSLETSFQDPEDGYEDTDPPLDVAGPDSMVTLDDWVLAAESPDQSLDLPYFVQAVETRQLADSIGGPGRAWPSGLREPRRDMWIRARGDLPDDPLLHACVLAYASDKPMLGTAALSPPLRDDPRPVLLASLDHSMWFQRPFRIDDWLLAESHQHHARWRPRLRDRRGVPPRRRASGAGHPGRTGPTTGDARLISATTLSSEHPSDLPVAGPSDSSDVQALALDGPEPLPHLADSLVGRDAGGVGRQGVVELGERPRAGCRAEARRARRSVRNSRTPCSKPWVSSQLCTPGIVVRPSPAAPGRHHRRRRDRGV